jgi:hypothetical protein
VEKKIFSCKERVALELFTHHGWDQGGLRRYNRALDKERVIYAIFSTNSKKIYIGQTENSAFVRFKSHLYATWNGSEEPLHRDMREIGWRTFYVIPLQIFESLDDFKTFSHHYEKRWMERLHTYCPHGWNLQMSGRKKKYKAKRKRPLLYQQNAPKKPDIGQFHKQPNRRYGSRDFNRRANFLIKTAEEGNLKKLDLSIYSPKILWKLKDFLEKENWGPDKLRFRDSALRKISNFLLQRKQQTKKSKDSGFTIFKILWQSHAIRRIPFRKIFLHQLSVELFPTSLKERLEKIRVVKKLPIPVGKLVFNLLSSQKICPIYLTQTSTVLAAYLTLHIGQATDV